MLQGRFSSWLRPILYFAGALFVVGMVLSIQGFTGNESISTLPERMPSLTQPFSLPDQLEFAGEPVPLYNFDTHEKNDRTLFPPAPSLHFFAAVQSPLGKTYAFALAAFPGQADDQPLYTSLSDQNG